MPIVTALHTILARPSLPQRRVIEEIAEISRRLMVMSRLGATTVSDVYDIALDRIDVIPPGIPNGVSLRHDAVARRRHARVYYGAADTRIGIATANLARHRVAR